MKNRIDGEDLRLVMRHVPSPVTIVTARDDVEMRGITIGSFTSASLDPPLVSFNVSRDAQMHAVLSNTPYFVIHILAEDQASLSNHFALPDRSGPEQLEKVPYWLDEHGTPVLEDALAVLFCRMFAMYPAGDHSIVVGEVEDVGEGLSGRPLLYYNRSYREVGPEVTPSWLAPVKRLSSDSP